MILLASVMVIQIVLRHAFDSAFIGIEELATLFAVWVYFPAAAYASWTGQHIKVGFVDEFFHRKSTVRLIRIVIEILSTCCALVYAYFATSYTHKIWYSLGHISPYFELPKTAWTMSMVIGLFAIACAHAWRVITFSRGGM